MQDTELWLQRLLLLLLVMTGVVFVENVSPETGQDQLEWSKYRVDARVV